MPLSVECPECGAKYNVSEALAGKRAKCKKCGATMAIPDPNAGAGEDESLGALMDLARESGEAAPPAAPKRRAGVTPPPGWSPESVVVEKESNPPPTAAFGSGRWQRKGGGLGRILKPLVLLVILGGLGYGGWYVYSNMSQPGGVIANAKDKLFGGKKEEKEKDPPPPPPPTEAEIKRGESAEDLKKIYAALGAHLAKSPGNWPADLATLGQDAALDPQALKSPFGPAFASPDYAYKPYPPEATPSADAVIVHDAAELASGEGSTLLFGDGSVKWLDKVAAQSALARSEEVRTAAVRLQEQKLAMARQQELDRQQRERQMREQQEKKRAETDPSYRPPARQDVVERIEGAAQGVAKGVQDIAMRRGTEQVIRPITPASAYAVLVRGQRGDTIEVFDGKAAEPVAAADFRSDPQLRHNPGAYALSPDGKLCARLESFPNLRAMVYSFEKKADVLPIDLDDKFGEPTIVGFAGNDRFLIRWQKAGVHGVEVWDAKVGKRGRPIELFEVQPPPSPGSEAVSADGRTYAIVDRNVPSTTRRPAAGAMQGQLQVVLYDLVSAGQPRRFAILGLENQPLIQPAGVAFSPDKQRLAALFVDPQGRGAVVKSWAMANGKPFPDRVLADQIDPPRAGLGRVRALDWVAGGRAWLINGTTVMSPDTGFVVATLAAGNVRGQVVTNETTAHLAYGDVGGIQGVAVVPLDESKLPASAAPSRAVAAPKR